MLDNGIGKIPHFYLVKMCIMKHTKGITVLYAGVGSCQDNVYRSEAKGIWKLPAMGPPRAPCYPLSFMPYRHKNMPAHNVMFVSVYTKKRRKTYPSFSSCHGGQLTSHDKLFLPLLVSLIMAMLAKIISSARLTMTASSKPMRAFIFHRQETTADLTSLSRTMARSKGHLKIVMGDVYAQITTCRKLKINYQFLITGKRKRI